MPVITLVINFGSKRWDGSLSLYEMMPEQPAKVKAFVQDYKVFLIDPMAMTDADLEHLNSSLREVLSYIKYQHDQEQMQRLLQEDNRFSELERNAALVIQATTRTELNIKPNAEVVDMCEAIRQMMESSKQQGVLQGMQQGMQQGRLQGRQEGIQQGEHNMQLRIARQRLAAKLPLQQISEMTALSVNELQKLQNTGN